MSVIGGTINQPVRAALSALLPIRAGISLAVGIREYDAAFQKFMRATFRRVDPQLRRMPTSASCNLASRVVHSRAYSTPASYLFETAAVWGSFR